MVLTCSIVHPSLHFIGGAERLMVDLAVGLADEGCVVEVVAGLCHKYWLDYIQQNGERVKVKVLGYKVPGNLLFWLNVRGFVKALARLISSECDAVITSSFPASLVGDVFRMRNKALILHYLHEAPMVLHDREGVMALSSELRLFYRFVSCFYRKFDLEAVCRSSRIIANSCFTRRVNAAVYGVAESGISVIYPGVDVMRLRGCVHELRFIGKYRRAGVPIIFFPRGVQSWRNSQVCVQALSRLRVGEFVGVFTGGSRYEAAALFKYARRIGVDQKLLWLGELADSDLFSLYSSSCVVVSVPKRQPFGLIPLEALVCGAPPVVSKSSGVSEVLCDGVEAVCVDAGAPEQLALAIEMLVSDKEARDKLVCNGRQKVISGFTVGRFVEQVKMTILNLMF